jgi:endo-1,4-beta-xylanase
MRCTATTALLSLLLACGGGGTTTTTTTPPSQTLRQVAAAHNIYVGAAADSTYLTSDASVAANFQRFAAPGLDLHITELDIRLQDSSAASLAAQAKLYGELATICVQQPNCKVFQTWGFTDKYSWIPSFYPGWGWALPFDANYQKKPAYTSILNAL